MAQVWEALVSIEFPVQPADTQHLHAGDAEIDFAARAFEARLWPALEQLRLALPGSRWTLHTWPGGAVAARREA